MKTSNRKRKSEAKQTNKQTKKRSNKFGFLFLRIHIFRVFGPGRTCVKMARDDDDGGDRKRGKEHKLKSTK